MTETLSPLRRRWGILLVCGVLFTTAIVLVALASPSLARAAPPAAPNLLQPTRMGYLSHPSRGWAAFLDWPNVPDAVSYEVFNADTDALLASPVNSTHVVFALPAGIYRYYVKAVNAGGERSDPSNILALTFVAVTPARGAPVGYRLVPNSAYDVGVTGAASQPASVTIPYDYTQVTGDPRDLRLFHWTGTAWEDITGSVNITDDTLSGTTTSFSDFAAGEPSASPPTSVPASSEWSLALLAVVGLGGVVAIRSLTSRA
jgi:hypothetical protein